MLRASSRSQRVWIFLAALLILGGMSWADTFDLTDDIPLSPAGVEQVLLSEEIREEVISTLVLGAQTASFSTPTVPKLLTAQVLDLFLFPLQSDLQVYQRVSTYRI